MELTVRELAERILPVSPDGDIEALVRQLRHWTLSGVLRPIGSPYTGAGRHRKYDEIELYFAALAVELTRWRIPVGISDAIVELVRKEYFQIDVKPTAKPLTFFKDAVDGKEDIYMLIYSKESVDRPKCVIHLGNFDELMGERIARSQNSPAPSFLVIHLSGLFRQLRS